METERFWQNMVPFSKCEKGAYNNINYGYRRKVRCPYTKRENRKAYRQIKKYGFDFSELWALDLTIMRWMSDTYGGFWRTIGDPDSKRTGWSKLCQHICSCQIYSNNGAC